MAHTMQQDMAIARKCLHVPWSTQSMEHPVHGAPTYTSVRGAPTYTSVHGAPTYTSVHGAPSSWSTHIYLSPWSTHIYLSPSSTHIYLSPWSTQSMEHPHISGFITALFCTPFSQMKMRVYIDVPLRLLPYNCELKALEVGWNPMNHPHDLFPAFHSKAWCRQP